MATEAQRRALSNYRKKSVRQIVVRFYPGQDDDELYRWVKGHKNVTGYLKDLVRADMEAAKDEG